MLHVKQAPAATLAVYIHWPFCAKKCPYCDFNSHVRERVDHAAWRDAYVRELRHTRDLTGPREIVSVFFGGGTPSLMEPSTTARIIEEIDALWGIPQGTEITLEANPGSTEVEKFRAFRAGGVNRVSIGVQALNDADLKALGRLHGAAEARRAVDIAGRVFDRFSFDLIYARQGQTIEGWRQELAEALRMAGGHLSLYQLTIEEGTPFHALFQRGEIVLPPEDDSALMYEMTQEMTAAAGLPSYEISNHARMGDESRHNLVYWRGGDYAGIGPGAHGRLTLDSGRVATRMHRAPEIWLDRVRTAGHGAQPFEAIDDQAFARERLMMGLRLAEGVPRRNFTALTGLAPEDVYDSKAYRALVDGGFLGDEGGVLAATPAGRQRLNALLGYLIR
jgi:oxygen-independent coproporphyrinogen-3 oxidase